MPPVIHCPPGQRLLRLWNKTKTWHLNAAKKTLQGKYLLLAIDGQTCSIVGEHPLRLQAADV